MDLKIGHLNPQIETTHTEISENLAYLFVKAPNNASFCFEIPLNITGLENCFSKLIALLDKIQIQDSQYFITKSSLLLYFKNNIIPLVVNRAYQTLTGCETLNNAIYLFTKSN